MPTTLDPPRHRLWVLRLYKVLDGLYEFYVALPRLLADPAGLLVAFWLGACFISALSASRCYISSVCSRVISSRRCLLVRMSSWIGLTSDGTGVPIPNIGKGIVHLAMITTKGRKLSGLRWSSLAQVSGKLIPLKYR